MSVRCLGPEVTARPVLLSSPHSGRVYPDWFLATTPLRPQDFRPLDDGPTDLFVEAAVAAGAGAVCALHPRAVVDLNRAPAEIDPALLPKGSRRGFDLTPRVRAGLGVIPTRVGHARIYPGSLAEAALRRRFADAYAPYHAVLGRRLTALRAAHGQALLLDVHSMPDQLAVAEGRRVDVALGDRFGRSCGAELTQAARRRLADEGLAVALNHPYAGGHITERYGRPHLRLHALQIEIRRGLFLDEATGSIDPAGVARLDAALARLVGWLGALLLPSEIVTAA
ncbi:MAG: N-formylglutamate amidohydrolase [Geminicoccaceae bacterium]|nr:N-formylglutamate amidohydrolase [Geminicoccaceae bacterium]